MIRWQSLAAGAVLLLAIGCIRRTERFVILPDGSGWATVVIHSDPEDIRSGDAMPSEASGWQTAERRQQKDDREEVIRLAVRRLAAGEAIPSSYAEPGTPLARAALQFPTDVTIERRADGTYYHFRRAYRPRRAAQIEYHRAQILESDRLKSITRKAPGEMTEEDRQELATALIAFEAARAGEMVNLAALSLGPALPAEAWLTARDRVTDVYQSPELLKRMRSLIHKDNADDASAAMEQAVRREARQAMEAALAESRLPASTVDAFLAAWDHVQAEYEVTADLADEEIEVWVTLPGRIIAHNAEKAPEPATLMFDAERETEAGFPPLADVLRGYAKEAQAAGMDRGFEQVTWTFEGKATYDREVILMATSFVPR
jgi:hypothetical protein